MEISQSERLNAEIFDLILTKGPITVYSASKKSGISLPTIHRHFKQMEKDGEIKIYRTEPHQSGNPKKLYGPKIKGILNFSIDFENIRKNIDSILEKWLTQKPFVKEIIDEFGFGEDFIKQDSQNVIKICKKYMRFYHEAFEATQDEKTMDENILDIGFFLLAKQSPKKTFERIKEIYETVPKYRVQFTAFVLTNMAVLSALNGDKAMEKRISKMFDEQEKAAKMGMQ